MTDPSKLHRIGDMDTSVEAAQYISSLASIYRQRVWIYALHRGDEGFTDKELGMAMAEHLGSPHATTTSTYRSRRNELTRLGMIVDTGRRKTHPPSHRKHAIWVAVRKPVQ